MLATLAQLKTRLGVVDTAQDEALTSLLDTASEKILDACAYLEATGVQVDLFRNVQQSREIQLARRPVVDDPTFVLEGRGHGTTFLALSKDLIDPDNGVCMILGAAEWWPPNYVEERRPRFRRWHEPTWPVVRATYTVTGIGDSASAPAQLVEGTLALATYWLGLEQAGATTSAQVGLVSQETTDRPMPQHVRSMLGRHYRRRGATWAR